MFDLLSVREYTDNYGAVKASFTKIGKMFPNKAGDGFSLILNALPIADKNGDVRVLAKKPDDQKSNFKQAYKAQSPDPTQPTPYDDLDDSVPF